MGSAQGRALRNGGTFYAINLASDTQEINGSTTRINWRCNVQFGDWYNWGLRLHVAVNGVEVGNWAGYCTYRGQIVINVSGSRDIGRSTGYQSVVVKAWTTSETVNGYGGVGTTTSCRYSEGINAKPSYTISYNANGGSGAPGKQTKWYGTNLTLSSTKPTRTGHNFVGWATSASGAVAYQPGSTYTGNAALTLYAKWTPHTYTVSYNANGGSGAPGNQTKTYGVNLTLSGTRPTRNLYNFKGWGISSSSTTASYQPGSTYTSNSGITLYAIWELAWLQPRITNLQATRCDSAGTLKEDGQYAKVAFNWATDRTISSIKIVCNGVTTNASGSGTSGSVSVVVGANALDSEKSYTVNVTVTDAVGGVTISTVIAPMSYIIDISPEGGIGFGQPAPSNKSINSSMNLSVKRTDSSEAQSAVSAPAGSIYLYSQAKTDGNRGIYGFNSSNSGVGILSVKQNNEIYINEKRVMHSAHTNGYWGIQNPDGGTNDWTRTTSSGIIPYRSGGASGLGTSSWPFNNVYTKNIHINNSRIADHVVASGTSGIWRYIKWNNGAAECWARELSVANANGFFAISSYNYPFNIYDASAVVSLKDYTHTSNTTHNMAFMDRNNTKVDVKIASDTGGIDNLGQKKIDVHIKGRWK